MPVTFTPSSQRLTAVHDDNISGQSRDSFALLRGSTNPECLDFPGCRQQQAENCKQHFQSSFADITQSPHPIIPAFNGFVDTALEAYNHHHHLVIRPDDVWMTILTQFNFFVNANAEKLRNLFVAHEGKKDLVVDGRWGEFNKMTEKMGRLIQENVIDPERRAWIIPDFTTTTPNDVIVSSVIMMATTKAYFHFIFSISCGIPKVTLLGEKEDWIKLLDRLEKLPSFGEETAEWYRLLKPVIGQFVAAFDQPDLKKNNAFGETSLVTNTK